MNLTSMDDDIACVCTMNTKIYSNDIAAGQYMTMQGKKKYIYITNGHPNSPCYLGLNYLH